MTFVELLGTLLPCTCRTVAFRLLLFWRPWAPTIWQTLSLRASDCNQCNTTYLYFSFRSLCKIDRPGSSTHALKIRLHFLFSCISCIPAALDAHMSCISDRVGFSTHTWRIHFHFLLSCISCIPAALDAHMSCISDRVGGSMHASRIRLHFSFSCIACTHAVLDAHMCCISDRVGGSTHSWKIRSRL